MTVSIKSTLGRVKVYIDGSLHLSFQLKHYRGMQSWNWYQRGYHIEIALKDKRIHLEYDDPKLWKDVLEMLDGAL